MDQSFDTLIMITPKDFLRLKSNYARLVQNLPSENLIFVGSTEVGTLLEECNLGPRVQFLNEDDILPFAQVHQVMREHLSDLLKGTDVPRGATGWYYQQFLKMQYSKMSKHAYYMTWDGDTIPCKPFSMFHPSSSLPYMDLKAEHHGIYFETMAKILPGMHKCITQSFISEHMLFSSEIMQNMIQDIENNETISGTTFYEKIIHAIEPIKIKDSAFSEFETYGTYICLTNPSAYRLREWHSFRLAGQFFNPDEISDSDYQWLSHDFDAISFEKNQEVHEKSNNIFNNPVYQAKMSARRLLEEIQKDFEEGYIEIWNAHIQAGSDPLSQKKSQSSVLSNTELSEDLKKVLEFSKRGDGSFSINPDQAFLSYQHAINLCKDSAICESLQQKIDILKKTSNLRVAPVNFALVSHNNLAFLQEFFERLDFSKSSPYHITLLDNHSMDGSTDYLNQIEKETEKITLLLSEQNLGIKTGFETLFQYLDKSMDLLISETIPEITKDTLYLAQMKLYESFESMNPDISSSNELYNAAFQFHSDTTNFLLIRKQVLEDLNISSYESYDSFCSDILEQIQELGLHSIVNAKI